MSGVCRMRLLEVLGWLSLLGTALVASSEASVCTRGRLTWTQKSNPEARRSTMRQQEDTLLALLESRGGAVLSQSTKSQSRTRTYKKTGFFGRVFGRAQEFIKAYFDSLLDPTYESSLATPTRSLTESARRRKARGGRRVGSISSLPAEPKG